jgi:hypothetical protein
MPSVNAGPSNTQTQNITAALTNPAVAGQIGSPSTVYQIGTQVGMANSGTMGANGAITFGTATGVTALGTGFYYFPAGAVYSGSLAGFYYTRMSSTTAGIVYNNIYSGVGAPVTPAASQLVLVQDAGPGAYTGVTTATTVMTLPVPGNIMGPNGCLQLDLMYDYNNTAGAKTCTVNLSGSASNVFTASPTTTVFTRIMKLIQNRGVTNVQTFDSPSVYNFGAASANTLAAGATDTTQPFNLTVTLTIAVATDYLNLHYLRLLAFYAP